MADGAWGRVHVDVPDVTLGVTDGVTSVIDSLNQVLSLGRQALTLAQSVVPTYLDPVASILSALELEIRALIEDYRQLGLYFTSDWELADYPFDTLKGGFQAFENRMLARLTDQSDPTRPDFSEATSVYGGFFYLSASLEQLDNLLTFLDGLNNVFNLPVSDDSLKSLPKPHIESVKYGEDAFNPLTFDSYSNLTKGPKGVLVSWKVPLTKAGATPVPDLPPEGFIVTLSTFEEGIDLMWDRAPLNAEGGPRDTGRVFDTTGTPVTLYGGYDQLRLAPEYVFSEENTGARVFGKTSRYPVVPLESLKTQGKYLFQRSFYLPQKDLISQWPTKTYHFSCDIEDFPYQADLDPVTLEVTNIRRPTTVFARVIQVQGLPRPGEDGFVYDFTQTKVLAGGPVVVALRVPGEDPAFSKNARVKAKWPSHPSFVASKRALDASQSPQAPQTSKTPTASGERLLTPKMLGPWSESKLITLPSGDTEKFLNRLQAALTVLFLVRPDLPLLEDLESSEGAAFIAQASTAIATLQEARTQYNRAVNLNRLTPEIETALESAQQQVDNLNFYPGPVALRRTGLESFRDTLKVWVPEYDELFRDYNDNPLRFRAALAEVVKRVSYEMYLQMAPSPSVQQLVLDNTSKLGACYWGDIFPELAASNSPLAEVGLQGALFASDRALEGLKADAIAAVQAASLGKSSTKVLSPVHILTSEGLAASPQGIGLPPDVSGGVFDVPDLIIGRAPHFWEQQVTVQGVPAILAEKYRTRDGSYQIPSEVQTYFSLLREQKVSYGTLDLVSPVYYDAQDQILQSVKTENLRPKGRIRFLRSALSEWDSGALMTETAFILRLFSTVPRKAASDGQWLNFRLTDAIPQLDSALTTLSSWVGTTSTVVQTTGEALTGYSSFLDTRLSEIQKFMTQVDSLLSQVLQFGIDLPSGYGLLVQSKGTLGVVQALMTADNKPSDSPKSYGAGACFLASGGPSILLDLFKVSTEPQRGSSASGVLGLEAIPPPTLEGPDDPPTVL